MQANITPKLLLFCLFWFVSPSRIIIAKSIKTMTFTFLVVFLVYCHFLAEIGHHIGRSLKPREAAVKVPVRYQ